jgi:Domain of unknown function (DUF5615)
VSQIRLLLDEDACSTGLAQALRSSGIDVVTVGEVDRWSFSDESHLIWAEKQGRSIYSHNMGDFCRLHGSFMAGNLNHAGIVLAPQQQYSIGQQLRGLLKLVASCSAAEMENQLVFLSAYIQADS